MRKNILLNVEDLETLMYIQIFILVKAASLLDECYWYVVFTVWETGKFHVEKFFYRLFLTLRSFTGSPSSKFSNFFEPKFVAII